MSSLFYFFKKIDDDSSSKQTHSPYDKQGKVQWASRSVIHSMPTTLVGHYDYTHFTEEELEAESLQCSEVTKLVNGGARILSKVSGSRVPNSESL